MKQNKEIFKIKSAHIVWLRRDCVAPWCEDRRAANYSITMFRVIPGVKALKSLVVLQLDN
jgi:hypothetical protein